MEKGLGCQAPTLLRLENGPAPAKAGGFAWARQNGVVPSVLPLQFSYCWMKTWWLVAT